MRKGKSIGKASHRTIPGLRACPSCLKHTSREKRTVVCCGHLHGSNFGQCTSGCLAHPYRSFTIRACDVGSSAQSPGQLVAVSKSEDCNCEGTTTIESIVIGIIEGTLLVFQ